MEQNVIAVIWDFDKTLVDGYMQTPIFDYYDVDEAEFWREVRELEDKYKEMQIKVNKDTIYLNHMLTCVEQGIFEGLNNKKLFEWGSKLKFYKGIPEIFRILKDRIENNAEYKKFNITLEHYIVSTGLAEMIRGSSIMKYVDGVWGCEFIETHASILKNIKSLIQTLKKQTKLSR
ncbi:MAG: hypothetical protein WBK73_09740 [Tepidanaerobacteraceae bacterium]|jgi:hypothetical protein